ncbi:MAG: hypothetical protein C5B46_02345 [Proteobacteria bacterium]|nr:MAG: hypothetical protein C5B46_02345 [Pseudomonadota bacterium]
MTDMPTRLENPGRTSRIDRYVRHMECCLVNAAKAPSDEMRALWRSAGESYALLAELERNPCDSFALGALIDR